MHDRRIRSFTVAVPVDAVDANASTISVILNSGTFYVNKTIRKKAPYKVFWTAKHACYTYVHVRIHISRVIIYIYICMIRWTERVAPLCRGKNMERSTR